MTLKPYPEYKDSGVTWLCIIKELDGIACEIGSAMNRINHEIDLFREYHIRLITDAVTGELDVRGVKLPAPDETEDMANLDIGEDVEVETIDEMEGVDA